MAFRTFATSLALALSCAPACADERADFYKGKTISFVLNYTVGGPTDTEARLLARHLHKYIPGSPTIVVKNMGGAGGAIGINWLGQVAPGDGDRKSTRLNSSHIPLSRMPSSA